jgi:hypothetical protein
VQSVGGLCLVRGEKLWFYYIGFQGDTTRRSGNWLENGMYDRGSTGIALLRRDGFVSMDAGPDDGCLTTRPVRFSGQHLFVNVDCPDGSLRVEVLDQQGKPIQPFTAERCRPISTDSTLEPVVWRGAEGLAALPSQPVRFRFHLAGGSLYSFWVSPEKDGRSNGYVAAGGPGYAGPTDTVGRKAFQVEKAHPPIP